MLLSPAPPVELHRPESLCKFHILLGDQTTTLTNPAVRYQNTSRT
ncbi:hypothetical protein SP19_145 [Salmonella phage 19]|nr:hypothetical protein SP19_145 [Salmonella phage 19]